MKLIHKATGQQAAIGDSVTGSHGDVYTIDFFREPHKPSSEGKVCLLQPGHAHTRELYVSCVGLEWIEREDRD